MPPRLWRRRRSTWHSSAGHHQDYTKRKNSFCAGCVGANKLFAFLRDHRHELFDDGFQAELEAMYRDTGAGRTQYRLPSRDDRLALPDCKPGMSDARRLANGGGPALADVLDCLGDKRHVPRTLVRFSAKRLIRH